MPLRNSRNNVDARQSVITEIHGNQVNIRADASAPETIIKTLSESNVSSAPFDSADRYPPPECLAGTRVTLINHITKVLSSSRGPRICWLLGMAGTGKSAVAQSIAEDFSASHRLAASFFFSRSEAGRNNTKYFFPTIAYQLTISLPSLKPSIMRALDKDPSIPDKGLRYQFQKLIIEPIQEMKSSIPSPMAIIIDAIDECEDERLVTEAVTLITEAQINSSLPFKFLVTSRPEPSIQAKFTDPGIDHSMIYTIDLRDFDVEDDIRTFLHYHLTEIARKRREGIRDISHDWPSGSQLTELVCRSNGLFIFAATVIKYIDDLKGHPVKRLDQLLAVRPNAGAPAYTELDQLYTTILSATSDLDIADLKNVLGIIVALFDPLPAKEMSYLISLDYDRISLVLERLHSIILIPMDESKAIKIFHESLRDFLADHSRSHEYFIPQTMHHSCISHQCLLLVTNAFNEASYQPQYLDWQTQYAYDHWSSHVDRSPYSDELFNDLQAFATKSMLFWIEARSISHDLDNALQSLQSTNRWLLKAVSSNPRNKRSNQNQRPIRHLYGLLQLFHEAEQYIREFRNFQPGTRVISRFWKIFRMKRRATFGSGRLYDEPTDCQCGYVDFISATPRQRLSYAWRRSAAFISLKRIITGELSPLHTVDASVGGVRRMVVHRGPSMEEYIRRPVTS